MAWNTHHVFVTGEVVTAAHLNQIVHDIDSLQTENKQLREAEDAWRQDKQNMNARVALLEAKVAHIARYIGRIEGELTIVRVQVLGDDSDPS